MHVIGPILIIVVLLGLSQCLEALNTPVAELYDVECVKQAQWVEQNHGIDAEFYYAECVKQK